MAAETLVGDHGAAVFDAIGTLDHHGERRIRRRNPARIAQQGRHGNCFAAAIDPALRIDEGIKAGGNGPPGDATVGQIECRRFQAEECIVGLLAGDDGGGRGTALRRAQGRLRNE